MGNSVTKHHKTVKLKEFCVSCWSRGGEKYQKSSSQLILCWGQPLVAWGQSSLWVALKLFLRTDELNIWWHFKWHLLFCSDLVEFLSQQFSLFTQHSVNAGHYSKTPGGGLVLFVLFLLCQLCSLLHRLTRISNVYESNTSKKAIIRIVKQCFIS